MGGLIIVAVEEPFGLGAMLVEEAYTSDGTGVDPLFRGRDDRESERIMTASFTLI